MNDWFVFAHALGAAQGLLLAVVLARRERGSAPNRLLSLVMAAFSLDLATAVYHATGSDAAFPHFIGIDFPLAFLYGPLLYLYARMLSRGEHTFRRSYLWHFLPFGLVLVGLIPFFLQSGAEKLAFARGASGGMLAEVLQIVTHVKIVHALLYVGVIFPLLGRHRRRMRETRSSVERVNLVWLRNLILGCVGLATMAAVLYLLSLQSDVPVIGLDPSSVYDDVMLLGLAILIYAIGYMGLRQPEIFDGRSFALAPAVREQVAEKVPYSRSGLDTGTAQQIEAQLLEVMEREKLYRRGDLTLQDLAIATGISGHNLTEVINTRLGQNFYDFVNGYRVRDVRERLTDPEFSHLTLLAIGMEAGFNSKSSFNAVFKKHTSMTPSEYRARAGGMAAT